MGTFILIDTQIIMNLVRKISPKTRDFTNFVSLHGQYAAYLIDDKTIELLDYTNFTNKVT